MNGTTQRNVSEVAKPRPNILDIVSYIVKICDINVRISGCWQAFKN
ncbi:MAG: hypothetical protein H6607_10920 [Flavobacteriales bacterium]|nr:hypothetical protein [Flavobacteriales bacterium]